MDSLTAVPSLLPISPDECKNAQLVLPSWLLEELPSAYSREMKREQEGVA